MEEEEAAVGGKGRLLALLAAAVLFLSAARRAAMLALRANALALLSTGPDGAVVAAGGAVVVAAGAWDAVDGSAAPHRRFRLRSFALPSFGASEEDAMAFCYYYCRLYVSPFLLFLNQQSGIYVACCFTT